MPALLVLIPWVKLEPKIPTLWRNGDSMAEISAFMSTPICTDRSSL